MKGTILDLMGQDRGLMGAGTTPLRRSSTFRDWDYGFDYYLPDPLVDGEGVPCSSAG